MGSRLRPARPGFFALAVVSALGLGALVASPARARPYYPMDDEEEEPVETTPVPTVSPSSLAGTVGVQALQRDVKSPDAKLRAAAIARAAETARDAGRLRQKRVTELKASSPGGEPDKILAEDPTYSGARALEDRAWQLVEDASLDGSTDDLDGALRVRLTAVRALADDTRPKLARARLRDVVLSPSPTPRSSYVPPAPVAPWMPPPPPSPPPPPRTTRMDAELVRLLRDTAAIMLAKLGDHDWLFQQATEKPDLQRSVLAAFAVAPPSAVPWKQNGTFNARTVEIIAAMRDLRGAKVLADVAAGKEPTAASTALRALAEMGDGRVAAIARDALLREGPSDLPAVRVAATEALAILHEPGSDAAVVKLASDPRPAVSREAARIAARHPTPALVPVLLPAAKAGDPLAIAALGRLGAAGVPALSALAKDDSSPDLADAAAYALAACPASAAADALASLVEGERSAATAARRRRAVRAGAVRVARIGGAPRAVRREGEALAGSTQDADRWVSALLAATLDAGDARDLLRGKDVIRRRAAAVGLGAHGARDAAEVARAHLSTTANEDDEVVRALAAIAARDVDGTAEHDVPISTSTLAVWLSEEGEAAPLAAFLLSARGGDAARPFVARALASDDLLIRGAALLGLGVAPERSAIGELAARYDELGNDRLRRACVRGLVARGDVAAKAVLDRARAFDPDPSIRAMAGAAVLAPKAVPVSPLVRGTEALQTKLVITAVGGKTSTVRATAATADGFTAPALADPEGFVLIFRVPAGDVALVARPQPAAAPKVVPPTSTPTPVPTATSSATPIAPAGSAAATPASTSTPSASPSASASGAKP